MRKLTIVILCCFYFLLASGLHVSLHFCCGELESIGAVAASEDACCGKKMKASKKKKCCQEKSFVYQIKNAHQISAQTLAPKVKSIDYLFANAININNRTLLLASNAPVDEAAEPPPVSKQKVFLRIGNFRI